VNWGWYPDVDAATRVAIGIPSLIVAGVAVYFILETIWPKEKW